MEVNHFLDFSQLENVLMPPQKWIYASFCASGHTFSKKNKPRGLHFHPDRVKHQQKRQEVVCEGTLKRGIMKGNVFLIYLLVSMHACIYSGGKQSKPINQSINQKCIILECIYQREKLFTLGRMGLCYCVIQAKHLHRAPATTYASHLMWDPEKMLVCCSWMRYFDQSALNGSACACVFALIPQSSFIKMKKNYRKVAGQPLWNCPRLNIPLKRTLSRSITFGFELFHNMEWNESCQRLRAGQLLIHDSQMYGVRNERLMEQRWEDAVGTETEQEEIPYWVSCRDYFLVLFRCYCASLSSDVSAVET